MNIVELKAVLEGLLFASGHEGLTINQISEILELPISDVNHLLDELQYDYDSVNRGMTMMKSNKHYHLTTKSEHNIYYKKMVETPYNTKLSQAALETLAIIAYKQPITRIEIEEIRGVNSDRAVQTLNSRSLIEEKGRKDTVGKPVLFGTTVDFLTFFGLGDINELPDLPEEINKQTIEEEADLFFEKLNNQAEEEK